LTSRPFARFVFAAALSATVAVAQAAGNPEPFTKSVPLDHSTATVTVAFHDDVAPMVTCTADQAASIGARAAERLEELLPVLYAHLLAKKLPQGTDMQVLLDAACYEGGIMGLGGYGRGEEKITLAYEESTDGKEWGPMKRMPITVVEPPPPEEQPQQ
jgi:hypothetical protein